MKINNKDRTNLNPSITPYEDVQGTNKQRITHSRPQQQRKVQGQLHSQGILPTMKKPPATVLLAGRDFKTPVLRVKPWPSLLSTILLDYFSCTAPAAITTTTITTVTTNMFHREQTSRLVISYSSLKYRSVGKHLNFHFWMWSLKDILQLIAADFRLVTEVT
jgi:hypothetical protein